MPKSKRESEKPRTANPQDLLESSFSTLWGDNGPMADVTKPLYNQLILLTCCVRTLGFVF